MTSLITFLDLVASTWIFAALVMSIFWGARAVFLFATDAGQELKPTSFRGRHLNWERFFQGSYQFLFNGVGSFAGWLCLYTLAARVHSSLPNLTGFTWGDVLLFLFALLGLTGHLPQAVAGFLGVFERIGEKIAQKLT